MRAQLTLFALSILLGLILNVLYFLQRLLSKKTSLVPVTVILDIVWCGISFAAFLFLSVFFADGQFHFFAACGTIAGFFTLTIIADSVKSAAGKRKQKGVGPEKKNTKKDNATVQKYDLKSQIDIFNKKNTLVRKKETQKNKKSEEIKELSDLQSKIEAFNKRNLIKNIKKETPPKDNAKTYIEKILPAESKPEKEIQKRKKKKYRDFLKMTDEKLKRDKTKKEIEKEAKKIKAALETKL